MQAKHNWWHFLEGMGHLAPHLPQKATQISGDTDVAALNQDWQAVSGDLHVAMYHWADAQSRR